MRLSIIIPLAPNETEGEHLLTQLLLQKHALAQQNDTTDIEIILVGDIGKRLCEQCALVLPKTQSRPDALNAGAKAATGDFLWFVHADTRLPNTALQQLIKLLHVNAEPALYYCDLRFLPDAGPLMLFNTLGVWLRSHWFKTPFGDQALLMHRRVFSALGGYPTNLAYGEDHALVIVARTHAIGIRPVGFAVLTSARKYREQGWAKTTCQHLYYTISQYWRSR